MSKPRGKRVFWLVAAAAVALVAGAAWYHWPRLVFAWRFESLGLNAQGYPEYRHRSSRIVFVQLPGGEFEMGSPETERGHKPDETLHPVTLSPFLIAKTEVSQGQWKRVMGEQAAATPLISPETGDELPATSIPWDTCHRFLAQLGAHPPAEDPRTPGFRLPTEAQWEYACRGGTRSAYCFGDIPSPTSIHSGTGQRRYFGDGAIFVSGAPPHLVPVGSYPCNAFGLSEMHGNAAEWCEDVYDPSFYTRPTASRVDPISLGESTSRVVRGGDAIDAFAQCRSASREFGDGPIGRECGLRPAYFPFPPGL